MKSFEKVMQRIYDQNNKPVHTVVKYNYTMEQSRDQLLDMARSQKSLSFEKIFDVCQDRIHAIFFFLSMLELVQQKFLKIIVSDGRNNFLIEYNENWETEAEAIITADDINDAKIQSAIDPTWN
jgi:segregation and condensation protein A